MQNANQTQQQPSADDILKAAREQMKQVKTDNATVKISLDGVGKQVQLLNQTITGVEQLYEQAIQKMTTDFHNEINQIKKELEEAKVGKKGKSPAKEPQHAMDKL